MQTVALTARQVTHPLLLVGAAEVEAGEIRARVDLLLADHDHFLPSGDLVPHGLLRIERSRLIGVRELHGLAHLERAGVRRFLAGDHAEERRLPRAVWPNDTDDAAAWQ